MKKITSLIKKIIKYPGKRIFRFYHKINYEKYLKNHNLVNLNTRNVKNCKLLVDRGEMLDLLPKNSVVAEIGVANGDFSREIIRKTNPSRLHLIDYFGTSRYGKESKAKVSNLCEECRDVKLHIGLSFDELEKFDDGYFDWVYQDTDHTYETTKRELEILKRKVKANGVIAGHDYSMFNLSGDMRYGVIEAVHEFIVNNDWEIIFLTSEAMHDRSFAIKPINK
jgi:hypothetical protein